MPTPIPIPKPTPTLMPIPILILVYLSPGGGIQGPWQGLHTNTNTNTNTNVIVPVHRRGHLQGFCQPKAEKQQRENPPKYLHPPNLTSPKTAPLSDHLARENWQKIGGWKLSSQNCLLKGFQWRCPCHWAESIYVFLKSVSPKTIFLSSMSEMSLVTMIFTESQCFFCLQH